MLLLNLTQDKNLTERRQKIMKPLLIQTLVPNEKFFLSLLKSSSFPSYLKVLFSLSSSFLFSRTFWFFSFVVKNAMNDSCCDVEVKGMSSYLDLIFWSYTSNRNKIEWKSLSIRNSSASLSKAKADNRVPYNHCICWILSLGSLPWGCFCPSRKVRRSLI